MDPEGANPEEVICVGTARTWLLRREGHFMQSVAAGDAILDQEMESPLYRAILALERDLAVTAGGSVAAVHRETLSVARLRARAQMMRLRALLAVRMNGAPLPRDHGFPVRLVVPGWYGCACIKWVNRIELVPDEAPATSQMHEFAARTHQPFDRLKAGTEVVARDFVPAVIDTAAMPVRVEKWAIDGRLAYRVVGHDLVLVDVSAGLVVDSLDGVIP